MNYRLMTDAEYDEMVDMMVDEWAEQFEIDSSYQAMIENQWVETQNLMDSQG